MSLSKKAIIIFGVKIGALLISFAISVLLARVLGVEDFGSYAYIIALIGMLGIPVKLGLPTLITRLTASYEVTKSWGLMKGLLKGSFKVISLMSLIIIVVAGFVFFYFYNDETSSIINNNAFYTALILIPLLAIIAVTGAALRGLHFVVLSQVIENIMAPLIFLLTIAGFYYFIDLDTTVNGVFIFKVISSFIVLFIALFYLWKFLPKNVKNAEEKYDTKNWFKSALPLFISGGMFFLNSKTDILMLGYFEDNHSVGLYQVASRGGTIMTFSLAVIAAVIAPLLSKLYTQKNYQQMQRIISKGALASFVLTIPLAILLIFWGDIILGFVFGDEYTGSYYALLILTLGFLFSSMMGSTGLTLNMTGFEKYTAIGVGISAILNVILNAILIPKMGIEGAALATSISLVVWNIILVIFVWKLLKINTTITGLFYHRKYINE